MNVDLGLADPWVAQEPAPQRSSTLREFLTICFRDRWRIAMAFLVPFVISVVVSFLPSPRYTSDASVLVRLGREYVYKPETGDANAATPMAYDSKETLRAEVEILNSLDIKEAVLQRMGVAKVYPWLVKENVPADKQELAALREMNTRFEARLLKDSNVIQLAFTHRDGAVAAQILNQVIETYLERRRTIFATGGHASAQAKVEALSTRLNDLEEKLANFKQTHGILAFSEQQSLLLGRQHTLDMKLDESALVLAQSGARTRSLQASLDFVAPEVTLSKETQRSDAVENARRVVLDLQLKEQDLSAKFSADTPAVQDARGAVARAQALLAELQAKPSQTVRTGRSPVRDNLESDWLRTKADNGQAGAGEGLLRQQRQAVNEKLKAFAGTQRELVALERERKLVESSYEAAVRRLEDALVQDELDRTRKSNVSIIQAARAPLQGKSMQGLILGVGFLLSVCCALLVAFLSALWRDTFLSPEQVQRGLGLPLLTSVPKVK
jgi:polysaccharide biosynthesis protein PslE